MQQLRDPTAHISMSARTSSSAAAAAAGPGPVNTQQPAVGPASDASLGTMPVQPKVVSPFMGAATAPQPSAADMHVRLGHRSSGGAGSSKPDDDLITKREDAELEQKVVRERSGLPTTIDGFRCHPLYVLERHITKYQVGST